MDNERVERLRARFRVLDDHVTRLVARATFLGDGLDAQLLERIRHVEGDRNRMAAIFEEEFN